MQLNGRDPHNLEDRLDQCIIGMIKQIDHQDHDLMSRVCLMHVLATSNETFMTEVDPARDQVKVTVIRDVDPEDNALFNDACFDNELIRSPDLEKLRERLDVKSRLLEGLQEEISFAICEKIFEQTHSRVLSGSRKVAPRGGGFSRDIYYKLKKSSFEDKDGVKRPEYELTLRSVGQGLMSCRIKQHIEAGYQDQRDFNPYQTLFEIIDDHRIEIGELSKRFLLDSLK